MKLAIIGTGYVGLVSGACFAELGHDVVCVDKDAAKIAMLEQGAVPIYEPGLEALLKANQKRIRYSTSLKEAVATADIIFIAVGTPTLPDGQPDTHYVEEAAKEIAPLLTGSKLIVNKSTVPVGMGKKMAKIILTANKAAQFEIASNPEFLREGAAVEDFMTPHRVVIGTENKKAKALMQEIYAPLAKQNVPMVFTDIETAEMIKYAANCFLATKIAFINEMADLCEKTDADVQGVAHGIGLDPRIGSQFLQPGPGFGGSCFPKDALALIHKAHALGSPTTILDAAVKANLNRRQRMVEKIEQACGSVKGKTLAILGLTFKAGTDDLRDSVSLVVIPALLKSGARIRAYDPKGMEHAKKQFKGDIAWCKDAYDCIDGADAAVILTEWPEFKELDLARVKKSLRAPLLIDLRNLWPVAAPKAAGLRYVSLGRKDA